MIYKILASNLKNWCLSHNGEEIRMKLQKIADFCYYSLVLNIIAIMCFSYKEETVWIFYGTTIFSVVLMLLYIVIKQKAVVIRQFHFAVFAWLGWVFASILWSIDAGTSLIMVGTLAQLGVYSLIMYEYFSQSCISVDRLVNAISIGVGSMGIYSLYYYGFIDFFSMLGSGLRLGFEINQENTYGSFAVMGVIAGLGQYFNKKTMTSILVAILSLLMVLASGSRAAILCCAIGVGCLIIIEYGYVGFRRIIKSSVVIGLVLCIIFSYFEDLAIVKRFDMFFNLFYSTDPVDNSTMTRLDMIAYGLEQFFYRPIQGYGINNFRELFIQTSGWATYSHNNFVELLVNVGFVGFVLYYYIYYIILQKAKKLSMDKKTILILTVITLVDGMFGPNYYSKILYIIFAMGYYSVTSSRNEVQELGPDNGTYKELYNKTN